jgi:hypothetical protein
LELAADGNEYQEFILSSQKRIRADFCGHFCEKPLRITEKSAILWIEQQAGVAQWQTCLPAGRAMLSPACHTRLA